MQPVMELTVAVEKQAYREAMARLGAAVNVITTDGPGGRAGFTASAVCSVTDTPPRCWSAPTAPTIHIRQ